MKTEDRLKHALNSNFSKNRACLISRERRRKEEEEFICGMQY